jgi:hypothetical protein
VNEGHFEAVITAAHDETILRHPMLDTRDDTATWPYFQPNQGVGPELAIGELALLCGEDIIAPYRFGGFTIGDLVETHERAPLAGAHRPNRVWQVAHEDGGTYFEVEEIPGICVQPQGSIETVGTP